MLRIGQRQHLPVWSAFMSCAPYAAGERPRLSGFRSFVLAVRVARWFVELGLSALVAIEFCPDDLAVVVRFATPFVGDRCDDRKAATTDCRLRGRDYRRRLVLVFDFDSKRDVGLRVPCAHFTSAVRVLDHVGDHFACCEPDVVGDDVIGFAQQRVEAVAGLADRAVVVPEAESDIRFVLTVGHTHRYPLHRFATPHRTDRMCRPACLASGTNGCAHAFRTQHHPHCAAHQARIDARIDETKAILADAASAITGMTNATQWPTSENEPQASMHSCIQTLISMTQQSRLDVPPHSTGLRRSPTDHHPPKTDRS